MTLKKNVNLNIFFKKYTLKCYENAFFYCWHCERENI
jgi:hypothetical protein